MTDDGKTHTGLRMPEGGDDGTEEYIDSAGNHFRLPSNTIEIREATSDIDHAQRAGSRLSRSTTCATW